MKRVFEFPEGFLWGTATSAHQIEGNNTNSDWWQWEQNKPAGRDYPVDPSGIACDSYNRYEEDFDLCCQLNNNAVRLSVEWARIEPKRGEFDQESIQHYKEVLRSAKQRNLSTFVTLHHFTSPIWFAELGGWETMESARIFSNYAARCAKEFGEMVDAFITINEPQVYALMAYTLGVWPPNRHNPWVSLKVQANLIRGHRAAYSAIKKLTNAQVGIAKNIAWYETDPFGSRLSDRIAATALNWLNDDFFLRPIISRLDFIGLNFYFTNRITKLRINNPSDYQSDLGWWINPGGLGNILKKIGRYGLPVYITENGVADAQDRIRAHFIRDMLIACGMSFDEGVDLRGYFYWSLIDNYEWHHGYRPRFGLVEIDREHNLERKPRPSFYYYADICKQNRLEVEFDPNFRVGK